LAKRTKSSVKKALYNLESRIVRLEHPTCRKCGKPATEVHHIFGRANLATAWDFRNTIPVCSVCHIFGKQSFEQAPYAADNMELAREWIEEHGATLEEIEQLSRTITHYSLEDLFDIELNLKNYYSQISA
jgi:5-methylcytosine-specific restriction endonuclease McrA